MKNRLSKLFLSLVCLASFSGAGHASSNIVTVHYSGNVIEFHRSGIRIADNGLNLRVSGPEDFYYEHNFPTGLPALFNANAREFGGLLDGTYRFQVSLNLTEQARDGLPAEGRSSDNFRQSGSFTVLSRSLVDQQQDEKGSTRDVVITDDQIVQGNLCVGLDCNNNESFEFDTIRLKENNLRIRFDDTSNSGSFPSNDWELRANDTINGGANQFSIADQTANREVFTVEAGAPESSLFVDDRGRVGFGTSTPQLDQHMLSGNTPATRFEQDGSGGFPSQTWDVGGNETEFFIRDSSNVQVPFSIQPGAPSDSLVINSAGDIEIGGAIVTTRRNPLPNAVFSPRAGKDRLSLDDLNAYIAIYGQLPGLTQSDTHDMLAFQMQLLEKIQELTLYTLEQEQRIADLERTLNASEK